MNLWWVLDVYALEKIHDFVSLEQLSAVRTAKMVSMTLNQDIDLNSTMTERLRWRKIILFQTIKLFPHRGFI